jgi:hypothetical protein
MAIEAIQTTLNKIRLRNPKFASNEEATQWLKSWGSDQGVKAPSCKISWHRDVIRDLLALPLYGTG